MRPIRTYQPKIYTRHDKKNSKPTTTIKGFFSPVVLIFQLVNAVSCMRIFLIVYFSLVFLYFLLLNRMTFIARILAKILMASSKISTDDSNQSEFRS